jgi:diguanylate cyclase (GGDEF)-like protein/PAS domain S-box-containing protein
MTNSTINPAESDLNSAFAAAMEIMNTSAEAKSGSFALERFLEVAFNNLNDGVIFVDASRRIQFWNRTMERMTDIASHQMIGNQLSPALLSMRTAAGVEVEATDCPVEQCLATKQMIRGEFRIAGRSGREVKVSVMFLPVTGENENLEGEVVVLNDASLKNDLCRQLKDLFEFSMVDPLTQVYNRSEFDRVLGQFIKAKNASDFRCSLIIADIDYFKSINDNFNHHVGDQCLVAFADLLKTFVRSNDLVARYGGEEFVILCGDCDLESAIERAEDIRATLVKTAMPMLDGKCITSSFGVAELKVGESAKDFFVRADSALLKAKSTGRNKVVEVGWSASFAESARERRQVSVSGLTWKNEAPANPLLLEEFVTGTTISMLVEKLRGYISETDSSIISVSSNFAKLQLHIEDQRGSKYAGNFIVEIEFQEGAPTEKKATHDRRRNHAAPKNFMRVAISEAKKRKWFSKNSNELAGVVMRELRRYFMISEEGAKISVDRAVTKSTREPEKG